MNGIFEFGKNVGVLDLFKFSRSIYRENCEKLETRKISSLNFRPRMTKEKTQKTSFSKLRKFPNLKFAVNKFVLWICRDL
jgi:hypothetical protein